MTYAVIAGGESGAAFLGSQGDIWDAQKDMLMDILGGTKKCPKRSKLFRPSGRIKSKSNLNNN
jgi:hypothetical protein